MKNRNPSRGPGRQLSNLYDGIIVEFSAADRLLPSMATFSEREGKFKWARFCRLSRGPALSLTT